MCYNAEYLHSIREKLPIKNICLVLAIINAIANALLLLWCIYGAYKLIGSSEQGSSNALGDIIWSLLLPMLGFVVFVTAVFSLLTFMFSVLLCIGIRKRRPGFLNAYVVYGVVISCLVLFVSVLHLCTADKPGLGIGALCGCALHALYIVLVYQTRVKVQEETMSTHIPLQEHQTNTGPDERVDKMAYEAGIYDHI